MESEKARISSRVKEERKRIGLSAEAFAGVLGIGKSTQYRYETGERLIDGEWLLAAAKAGIDVYYVLTGSRLNSVDVRLMELEQRIESEEFDNLLAVAELEALRPEAGKIQLARIDLLLSLLGESASQKARDLTLSDLARKSQLARERAAKLASGGLLLEVLATAYFHGINDEGAAQLAAMLTAPLAANS